MPRKKVSGVRRSMSQATRDKIAASLRKKSGDSQIQGGSPSREGFLTLPAEAKDLEIVQMKDQVFHPDLFVPMPTGKSIDSLFSVQEGIPKATNYLIVGDPGVGKSTVALDIVSDLVKRGYRCLFISAEMTRIDLHLYVKRFPKFGNVDTIFLGEYLDSNPAGVIEQSLHPGYDVVLIDSFVEVQDIVKEALGISARNAERWVVEQFLIHNLANNEAQKNTTFLVIQQVTKGGVFLGSNKLKHNTTGMMEIRFDEENPDLTYITFSKNRRGRINQRMYFDITMGGNVVYQGTIPASPENLFPFNQILGESGAGPHKNPFST